MNTQSQRVNKGVVALALLWLLPGIASAVLSATGFEHQQLIILAFFLGIPFTAILCYLTARLARDGGLWPVAIIGIALVASVLRTYWPLRISFALEHKRLDALANILESGGSVSTPQWVGPFCIRKAELNQAGMPCLWIWLDPYGYTGLARPRDGVAKGKYNDWSDLRLDDKWHLIGED